MSPLLLRAFVNERLTAAAEEIFQVFERTIAQYEEEASSSNQEIERLRGLLRELSKQRTDVAASSVYIDKTPEQGIQHGEPEPRRIKEEDDEVWAAEQQKEEQPGEETDAVYQCQPFAWEHSKQEDTKPVLKPVLQTQMETCEVKDEFQEMQEADEVQLPSSLASTPSSHNGRVQDGGDSERPAAASPSDQARTEQGQTTANSTEFTELSHSNSAGADYQCHSCSKSFSSHHWLINHAFRFHSQDSSITCAVCGRTFESTGSLDAHLKSHKSSKCCHICGKRCNSSTALTEHMAGHAGVKLHRCHVCGKECSRKGDLKIHMRIHTGEKPFCCSFCCKGFTHSGHLKKHMRSHTGERPHRCEVCGRGFLQSAHLKYHLGTHTQKY